MSIRMAPAGNAAHRAHERGTSQESLPFGTGDALRELPSRRPADPPARASSIQWTRVGHDRYEVRVRGRVVGFIDVVGAVYVALAGPRYDRAEEAAQTLVWTDALSALLPPARHGAAAC